MGRKAGYCQVCQSNVWLNDDASCAAGHPANCVVGVYDPSTPLATPGIQKPAGDIGLAFGGTLGALVVMFIIILMLDSAEWAPWLALAAIGLLVFLDARELGTATPGYWGICVVLLLIVALPVYLYRRPILRWEAGQPKAG